MPRSTSPLEAAVSPRSMVRAERVVEPAERLAPSTWGRHHRMPLPLGEPTEPASLARVAWAGRSTPTFRPEMPHWEVQREDRAAPSIARQPVPAARPPTPRWTDPWSEPVARRPMRRLTRLREGEVAAAAPRPGEGALEGAARQEAVAAAPPRVPAAQGPADPGLVGLGPVVLGLAGLGLVGLGPVGLGPADLAREVLEQAVRPRATRASARAMSRPMPAD